MYTLGKILHLLLDIYLWVIIATVVISWLIAFDVINMRAPLARKIVDALNRMTEPVLKKIREYVPPVGGIDLSPLVVIIGIYILQYCIREILMYP